MSVLAGERESRHWVPTLSSSYATPLALERLSHSNALYFGRPAFAPAATTRTLVNTSHPPDSCVVFHWKRSRLLRRMGTRHAAEIRPTLFFHRSFDCVSQILIEMDEVR